MLVALYTIVVVLLLFGVTIFVHEFGHFLAARACGLVVDVFSIGFGPALWKRKLGGVTYKIGLVPFGGYVTLPQMDPNGAKAEGAAEPARDLPPAAPWKKIIVALSGVVGNMILAVFLAYLVYWIGKPSSPHERNCIVGTVDTNSAVYAQGLRIGDEIASVNGEPVGNWDELTLAVALRTNVLLGIRSAEGPKQMAVPTEENWTGIRMVPGIGWVDSCSIASVDPGSSAERAGIRRGDVIVEFAGTKLYSRDHLIEVVNRERDRESPAKIRRDGEILDVLVTPQFDPAVNRARIGVVFSWVDVDFDQVVHPRPGAQIREHATTIFRILRALLTPRQARAASKAVGGPVSILFMFWITVRRSLMLAIWFTGMLNVNLAVINLLPIPVVDGGHVVFGIWEWVTRRPIGARVYNTVMNFFATLLIAVFVLLTYRDIVRWFVPLLPKFGKPAAEQPTNPPPAEPLLK